MKIILQNLLKIITIGILCEKALSNRQYIEDPSVAYYPSRAYFSPNPYPYHQESEPEPEYYEEELPPEPVPYEEEQEYYSPAAPPPQMMRYNRNYYYSTQLPPPEAPQNRYPISRPPYLSSLRMKIEPSQENFNTLRTVLRMTEPEPSQLPQSNDVLPTIIIEKEGTPQTYYPDENKVYLEDEYSDNYGDEGPPPPPEAASLNYPYQYFEPVRLPDHEEDGKLIYSYPPLLQADFKEIIPVLKSPITILPSRFPPRIEQIIQRIQNYFSTYNPQVEKPAKNPNSTIATSNLPTTTNRIMGEPLTSTNAGEEQTATPGIAETSTETMEESGTAMPTAMVTGMPHIGNNMPIAASNASTEKIVNDSREEISETTQTPFQLAPNSMEDSTETEGNTTEPARSNLSGEMPQTYNSPDYQNQLQRYYYYMQNAMPGYTQNMSASMATSGYPFQNSTAPMQMWNYTSPSHHGPSSYYGQYMHGGNVSNGVDQTENVTAVPDSTSVPEIDVRSSESVEETTNSIEGNENHNQFSVVPTSDQMANRTPSWNNSR